MKHPYSTSRLRQALAVSLLGLFFSGSFYVAQRPAASTKAHPLAQSREVENEEEEGDEDGDRVYPDRPDLALEQDADLTRDPATGTVPRERLLAAARYNIAFVAARRPTAGTLASAAWTERGPNNVAGRIRALLIDPTDVTGNTLWAGAAGGGLWKATNAATGPVQWQNANSAVTNLAVTAIAAVPGSSPQVLYCGTGEGYFNGGSQRGAGLWKSTDNGLTWVQLASTNNSNFYFTQKIVVYPGTGDVYAATHTGLWRSQNGGSTWSLVLGLSTSPGTATSRVADLEIGADNTLFVSFGIRATDGIYRSASGNLGSWTRLNTPATSGLPSAGFQRIELACAPSDANRLYALLQSTTSNGLLDMYRSLDKGDTWTVLARPGATAADPTFDFTRGQAWYDLIAAVSPNNPDAVYVGGVDLWLSTTAGATDPTQATWTKQSDWRFSNSVHADHHAIAYLPSAPGAPARAYFGNDGGVFYSANANVPNALFAARNTGLNVTQFYAVAMHPTNYNYFLAGAQDNYTQKFTTPGMNATTAVSGGDGGFCAIDQLNPNVQFSSYVYNQYFRSVNGGASFSSVNLSATAGSFINPFDYDSRAGVLYGAYTANAYVAWTNAGNPAVSAPTTLIHPLGTGLGNVTHVTVAPLTRKRIYVGTNAGAVLRVDSANTLTPVVATVRAGTAGTSVSCVAVDPADEQHLLVTYANYGIVSVFETRNAEAPAPTWTAVEGALPDMPVRWALFDPRNPARALLATEMGVYSTELLSGGATMWEPANNGFINTRIDMLRYRAGDQLVAAATYGRGLFTTDVLVGSPLATRSGGGPSVLASVYPNPFSTELRVELAAGPAADVTLALTDALGRQVLARTQRTGTRQLTLPVPAGLAPGTYVLTVRTNGRQSSRKVVRE